jgi:glycosyltransferase involved in cell wall biosynthesis
MKIIILPTYNEYSNLAELLAQVYNQVADIHVLVVDDNSHVLFYRQDVR